MLHRKLILTLGSLIVMMLGTAIWAIVLFALAVGDLSQMGTALLQRTTALASIERDLADVETRLTWLLDDPGQPSTDLADLVASIQRQVAKLIAGREMGQPATADLSLRIEELADRIDALQAAPEAPEVQSLTRAGLSATLALRQALSAVAADVQVHFDGEHTALISRLRWWAFGLGLMFIATINLSILVILRSASMVLQPVDELVEASRHYAAEEFDYRVPVHRRDEFGELARATNLMAERLMLNEQRRFEVLQQIARTLNHELNNAIAIIDAQLHLFARAQAKDDDPQNAARLRGIHETLRKMGRTVASLGKIRKVVLTDYVGDAKMLDLQRSIAGDDDQHSSSTN